MAKLYPKVGIGVMIENKKGEVLLGLRQKSHGAGEWCFPGGHLEFGETILEAAQREVKEEVGLDVDKFKLVSLADEMRYLKSDNKHYLNVGLKAEHKEGKPMLREPDKYKEWRWFSFDNLPDKLFEGTELMIKNFKAGKIY